MAQCVYGASVIEKIERYYVKYEIMLWAFVLSLALPRSVVSQLFFQFPILCRMILCDTCALLTNRYNWYSKYVITMIMIKTTIIDHSIFCSFIILEEKNSFTLQNYNSLIINQAYSFMNYNNVLNSNGGKSSVILCLLRIRII